ncbi:MAG TPA: outer membrane beta-barrel protein [Terracidiphilus sp.]
MKVCSFLALCPILFAAQTWPQAHPTSGDVPSAARAQGEIFGGFSLAAGGASQQGSATGAQYGFNGGLDFPIARHFYLVAEVSQFSHPTGGVNTTSDTAFLFGPRYLIPLRPNSRVSVFGEFLLGGDAYHNTGQAYTIAYNSKTSFAFAIQGGLDYALSRRLSARFEGGYLRNTLYFSSYGGPPNPATASNNRGRFVIDFVYRF